MITITDTRGSIEYVNKRFTEVTGYSFQEVKGKNPNILKSGHTPKKEYQALWQTILSGKTWQGELVNVKKNGERYHEKAIISPVIINDTITHFISVKEDITEKRKMEESISQLTADALFIHGKNKIIRELSDLFGYFFERYAFSEEDKKSVNALLHQYSSSFNDWKNIKTHFELVHKDFFKKLSATYPHLTQHNLRHCAYIKMNFSTKEISRMLNVRPSSIQTARVRLKQKLNLGKDEDLIAFIQNF